MKNDEKAMLAGVGALFALSFLREKEEKKVNIPNLSISPPVFYAWCLIILIT